jgi:hypothetical protein
MLLAIYCTSGALSHVPLCHMECVAILLSLQLKKKKPYSLQHRWPCFSCYEQVMTLLHDCSVIAPSQSCHFIINCISPFQSVMESA